MKRCLISGHIDCFALDGHFRHENRHRKKKKILWVFLLNPFVQLPRYPLLSCGLANRPVPLGVFTSMNRYLCHRSTGRIASRLKMPVKSPPTVPAEFDKKRPIKCLAAEDSLKPGAGSVQSLSMYRFLTPKISDSETTLKPNFS